VTQILENRYLLLLLTLLSLIALHPFAKGGSLLGYVLAAVGMAMVVLAVRAAKVRPRSLVTLLAIGLGGRVLAAAGLPMGRIEVAIAGHLLGAGFVLWTGLIIVAHVMRSRRVTMDTVFGAACTYLLLGILWSEFYIVVALSVPNAFNGVTGVARGDFGDIFYYSYITLTTVGYGDVSPAHPTARVLAMLEGLIGQLYVAIIIARMVGLQIAERLDGGAENR
jgi:hypothetical protein